MTTQEFEKKLLHAHGKTTLYDFDFMMLKIADTPKNYIISISLNAFSEDFATKFQRPYIPVMHIKKPATEEYVKEKACEYITYLQTNQK